MIDRTFAAFSCFACRVSELARGIEETLQSSAPERAVASSQRPSAALRLPAQLYNPAVKTVTLWEPRTRPLSTILVPNITDGWSTLVYSVSRRSALTCAAVRISSPDNEWPIVELNYIENGNEKRLIRAMKDDPKWQFLHFGDPLPFEEQSFYSKRRIRDRFPPALLFQYLSALGWDATNPGFWQSTLPFWEIQWPAA